MVANVDAEREVLGLIPKSGKLLLDLYIRVILTAVMGVWSSAQLLVSMGLAIYFITWDLNIISEWVYY